jgi:galactose mutarotase-like enzyme
MWSAFSGQQFEIRHGRQRAVVVEVGGGLREYEVDGHAVVDGYAVDRMADGGRGQPLLPWPNRLADGRYTFAGQHLQVPIDELARHNATHGLTRWLNWSVAEQAEHRVRLEVRIHPRPGYPFTLQLSIEYLLTEAGLTVRTTARNDGLTALPFGAGQHPYFTVGTPLVDAAELRIQAGSRLELDPELRLPTGRLLPVGGSDYDFRQTRTVGALVIDDCFSSLDRDGDGVARVSLSDPVTGRALSVWMDSSYRYVQVYTGDTLAPERRRRGLAIEPMTCPPNAFRTSTDLIVLQPEESCALEWGLSHALLTND